MKILYHFRTRGTGAEAVHIAGIATAFEDLGHTVEFCSPTGIDPRASAGSSPFNKGEPVRLPAFAFELAEIAYNLVAFAKVAAIALRNRPALVYERHAFFLCSTAVLCRLFGLPFVVEVNELVGNPRVREQPLLSPLARLADRISFGLARLIVVVSPDLQRRVLALGVGEPRVLTLPNAVRRADVATLSDGSAVRSRLDCPPECVLVGFVGWFVAWHRLDLLLEALAQADRPGPEMRLLMVGEGPLGQQLRDQSARLGIAERVLFVGAVPHEEIPKYVAAMDICVVPHSNEFRSPIKLFEYMAQGRAVVAPATEPIAAVVKNDQHAVLFEPGVASSLASALVSLAGDSKRRDDLGARARLLVLEHHTWERNATSVLAAAGLT